MNVIPVRVVFDGSHPKTIIIVIRNAKNINLLFQIGNTAKKHLLLKYLIKTNPCI